MASHFRQTIKKAARSRMDRYGETRDRAGALDGYSRLAWHEKAGGGGPRGDPTAGTAMLRESSPDVLWILLIEETLRAVDDPVRALVRELWTQPAVKPGVYRRYEKIADRLHISVSTLYSWRDQFLLELGSRAYARGLVRADRDGGDRF